VHDVIKKFDFCNYNLIHNSPFAVRGVGIAIKKNLPYDLIDSKMDRSGNILALKRKINNVTIVISAIYGPNENSREFYADLTKILTDLNCENVLIGGDWNSTWDLSPPENNLDVINMANLPSRYRSEQVQHLSTRFNLVEPFRFRYPSRKDFTYIPNARANVNRSRIDFFLISSNLIQVLIDKDINTGRLSTLFDHKSVNLKIGGKKYNY
jgi:exonuclease III